MPLVTITKTIATTGAVLRTPVVATIRLAVIHGTGATYPDDFVPISQNAMLTPPSIAPSLTATTAAGTLGIGQWTVSYAWTNTNRIASPNLATFNGITTPSPPASVTLASGQVITATVTGAPIGATGIVWYLAQGGTSAVRYLAVTSATLTGITLTAPATSTTVEQATNTTLPVGAVFGRSDDESGNAPVPIPQSSPTTSYSFYKTLSMAIPRNGNGNTNITNIALRRRSVPPSGLGMFYRVVATYVRNDGIPGLAVTSTGTQTGHYPQNDQSPHTGNSANTPPGYTAIPAVTTVVSTNNYWTGNIGRLGPFIQLVVGVADRKSMVTPPGQASLPALEVYYDEI